MLKIMKAEKKESEMSDRPTPETDAACGHASNWDSLQGKLREEVPAEFARRLERERDEARERYNELLGVEVTK
jgi:hypothetical protein